MIRQKFKVIKRIEVPKAEYSYDAAVQMIVELNEQYNPSWIYCDRGAGEYQIERLHIIGDENPHTGLKNKVRGWQFKNVIEVMDPITKETVKEPMKPFMVNQLQIAFEREKLMLSPYDDYLHKQLVDYEVLRQSSTGVPVYTSENEHFIDALGLAYLAFVLEFSEITDAIKKPEFSSKIKHTSTQLGEGRVNAAIAEAQGPSPSVRQFGNVDRSDLRGDRPTWFKVDAQPRSSSRSSWGTRRGGAARSSW